MTPPVLAALAVLAVVIFALGYFVANVNAWLATVEDIQKGEPW